MRGSSSSRSMGRTSLENSGNLSPAARSLNSTPAPAPSLVAAGTLSWPQSPCGLSRPYCHIWTSQEAGLCVGHSGDTWRKLGSRIRESPGRMPVPPHSCWVIQASHWASRSVRWSKPILLFTLVGFPVLPTFLGGCSTLPAACGSRAEHCLAGS